MGELTWARFREIVTGKYYPPSYQVAKGSRIFQPDTGKYDR